MPLSNVFADTPAAAAGRPYLDFGARLYDPRTAAWLAPDPLSEKYYPISPYAYCAGNPVNLVDPTGMDWYVKQNSSDYVWWEGNSDIDGYDYWGPRGSLFGEAEDMIDEFLQKEFEMPSLFSNGFTLNMASPTKTGSSINYSTSETGFLWDFLLNIGPEVSVIPSNHPFTESLKKDVPFRKDQVKSISDVSDEDIKGIRKWTLWDVFTTPSPGLQFIGSYAYYSRTSERGQYIYNLVGDQKTRESLFFHLPLGTPRRSRTKLFGNTYQLYLWVTPHK